MKDCIFCKIINGKIPCMKLYEDDIVLAYLDIAPDSDGHTLIIPKKHYKDIFDISNDTLFHIYNASKIIMKMLEKQNREYLDEILARLDKFEEKLIKND